MNLPLPSRREAQDWDRNRRSLPMPPPESDKPYVPPKRDRAGRLPMPPGTDDVTGVTEPPSRPKPPLPDYLAPPPERPWSQRFASSKRRLLDAIDELRPSCDGQTVLFDPEADLRRTWELASNVFILIEPPDRTRPAEMDYALALMRLATATVTMLEAPSASAVDAWQKARAEHEPR